MILGHTLIIIGLAILVSILILALSNNSRLKLFTRLFGSSVAVFTVICLYYSIESLYGWPFKTTLPTGKFYLISYHVPTDQKEINIWLVNRDTEEKILSKYLINDRQPRSISVYYDENLHEQLQKISKMADGKPYPVKLKLAKGKKKKIKQDQAEQKENLMYILPDIKVEQK